ncbi:MAG: energy-coupling factor transporter transmembrane protein EcfT [Anaeromicrobium sp.]|jgi:cobalt/nickel transport system permease protein|uniref:energy-coupling factor transporter transmembrane component T n=1 Tax=Anaeromicrobium sp. TaxID=1929132 RepID=UPI0025D9AA6F|nr:energy-coupling factor transporter transmembrane component T [Anaeromicrobium sp.]MCT4595113.1 energy-coupling factor transporter transmembrane protein EcfT [Anaeromicrobium sp.]
MNGKWLLEKDDYVPKKERDTYIDKSIISFLKIISRIRSVKNKDKVLYRIDPVLKVIFTVLNILFISLSRNFIYLFILDIYVFMSILFMDWEDRKKILSMSFIFPIMTLIMLIPSMIKGNIHNSLLLLQRILLSVLFANILSYSTKWTHISRTLKLLFVPDIFIWIMDISLKYSILLGEYATGLLYGLKLRSIGKNEDKQEAIWRIMGNLFLKSYRMSEELSCAMECRGFVGEYKVSIEFKLRRIDYIYGIINIIVIVLFVILNY